MATKLLVGLGNPGPRYENTRHNIGFLIVDELARRQGVDWGRQKFQALFAEYRQANQEKVILLKPQTWMNRSGESIQPWVHFLKIQPEDLLVIHDELDLPLGRMKVQKNAGAAGNRGVLSTIEKLGHQDFCRLRVGIGRPTTPQPIVDWVLTNFAASESEALVQLFERASDAVALFLEKGLDPMAQMINTRGALKTAT